MFESHYQNSTLVEIVFLPAIYKTSISFFQLEKMGYNVGIRLVEDFLARTGSNKCTDFRDTAEKIQMAFKMFLNISPTVTGWNATSDEFSLIFDTNPIAEFVELPDHWCGSSDSFTNLEFRIYEFF